MVEIVEIGMEDTIEEDKMIEEDLGTGTDMMIEKDPGTGTDRMIEVDIGIEISPGKDVKEKEMREGRKGGKIKG